MTELQNLINRHMLTRGGGIIPMLISDAAKEIGISQPALTTILNGTRTPNLSTCLRLARWLGLPLDNILTLAGHADLIPLLVTQPSPLIHPAIAQFARAVTACHNPVLITAALESALTILRLDKTILNESTIPHNNVM